MDNSLDFETTPQKTETPKKAPNFKKVLIMLDDIIAESKDSILVGNLLKNGYSFWISKKWCHKNEYCDNWCVNATIDENWKYKASSNLEGFESKELTGTQVLMVFDRWIDEYEKLIGDPSTFTKYKVEQCHSNERLLYLERMQKLVPKYLRLKNAR